MIAALITRIKLVCSKVCQGSLALALRVLGTSASLLPEGLMVGLLVHTKVARLVQHSLVAREIETNHGSRLDFLPSVTGLRSRLLQRSVGSGSVHWGGEWACLTPPD